MGIMEYFNRKRKEKLPLIARVDLTKLQKEREKQIEDREVSILAAADYTKRLPTIRLYYVSLEKFTRYGTGETKIGQTYEIYNPYRLPYDMTIEDACKVISYLSDKVEKENNLDPASKESVAMVDKLLGDYGFKVVYTEESGHYHTVSEHVPFHKIKPGLDACKKMDGVVDLFTVGGDFKVFRSSEMNERYFNWYTEGVKKQEVVEIFKNVRQDYWLEDKLDDESQI